VVNDLNYTEAVEYIFSIPKFTTKNKIDNTVALMEQLGRPDRNMKIIHVAGTNGKGSVCAFISSILVKAGKLTGLFTSPHLVKINERFQINGKSISDESFLAAYEKVQAAVNVMQKEGFAHPTYFELLFAVSMMAFQDAGVEYAVLETGLGGRLDATNVVENPVAVILTSISLDHTEILGDTIEKIAWEKAGIIKEGVPVIYDGRNPEVERIVRKQAAIMNAHAFPLYEEMYEILLNTDKSIDFSLNYEYYENVRITVPYVATYQVINCALALLAMNQINRICEIPMELRIAGIRETTWQGRMETVMPGVVLDGAHNLAGIKELIKTIRNLQKENRIVMLFSAVAEKEFEEMIKMICHLTKLSAVIVTQIDNDRGVSAEQLADAFRRYTDVSVRICPAIGEAFCEALRERQDGILFCAGSLYLIGELKCIMEGSTYD